MPAFCEFYQALPIGCLALLFSLFAGDNAELVSTGLKGAKSLMVLMRVLCMVMAVILAVVMMLFA